jgi:hypothetical protein
MKQNEIFRNYLKHIETSRINEYLDYFRQNNSLYLGKFNEFL